MPATRFLNVPNLISVLRVGTVPAIVILLASIPRGHPGNLSWDRTASFWAAFLFGVAAVSDIIDGFLARRFQTVTTFGKFFDPLADKLLTFGALVMLIPLGRMAAWVVVLLLARELAVTTLRGIASGEGIVMAAGKWGKMKNAFGNVGIPLVMLHYPHGGIAWASIGWVLFFCSIVLAIWSGGGYLISFFRTMGLRQQMFA
ncbi:MAG: CDP-diacylglycerol--glycerol-3-phosphate 3-phosphatidyltransferase [Deltaproteobacteria bacterium]|nr:CDP-diacylglycerol--glycerol-3-phosphate 3-phosphatidyltransferase [Deltaproteobacteria bacterium]